MSHPFNFPGDGPTLASDLFVAMKSGTCVKNKQVTLRNYVSSVLKESDMEVRSCDITLDLGDGGKGDVLVKNVFLSCDPYMRIRMSGQDVSHSPPFQVGQVLEGFGVSKVVVSNNPKFKPGDYVSSWTRWEQFSVIAAGERLEVVDPHFAPLSYYLGALGMPGFTAYVGFFEILKPKRGETIFVSAASGAVGQIVGQLAREAGLYVVGSAGSGHKVELLKSKLGYNAAFNYKEEDDLVGALKTYCPGGIDMYFENVGGHTLDAVLENMKSFGRIAVSGMISQYNNTGRKDGIFNLSKVISRRIRIQGFLQSDYVHLRGQFRELMGAYLRDNKLVYYEDFAEGLDSAPHALCRLMSGDKIGKQIVRVSEDLTSG